MSSGGLKPTDGADNRVGFRPPTNLAGSRMLEKNITITNRLGLHARASAKLVQALHGFQSATSIAWRGKEVNAKSIMGVMMLAAGLGAEIRLKADGPDEEAAMAAMVDLFERKFDEGQ